MDFKSFLAADAKPTKRGRDAFVYFERDIKDFAQCASCELLSDSNQCLILGHAVRSDDSCVMYIPAVPGVVAISGVPASRMTDKEVGFVHGQVRCENCVSLDGTTCQLFVKLNEALPEIFELETKVSPKGCCNAWEPK